MRELRECTYLTSFVSWLLLLEATLLVLDIYVSDGSDGSDRRGQRRIFTKSKIVYGLCLHNFLQNMTVYFISTMILPLL